MTRMARAGVGRAALATVLLAAGLLLPSLGAHAQSGGGVAVASFAIIGADPAWLDGTPVPTRIQAVVENRGSTPMSYELAYYWEAADDAHYLNGDAPSSTDVSRGVLQPHATATHEADWTPLSGQQGHGHVVVEVRAGTSPPELTSFPLDVPVHALETSWAAQDPSIRDDETRFFRLAVRNAGSDAEVLSAQPELVGAPANGPLGATLDTPSLRLEPGATATVQAFVHRSFADGPAPPPTDLAVRFSNASAARWSPRSAPFGIQPGGAPLDPSRLDATLTPPAPLSSAPGQEFHLRFVLANTGQEDQSFRLAASGPHGWGIGLSPAFAALRPGEEQAVTITGSVPPGDPPGVVTDLLLTATSDRVSSGSRSAVASVRSGGPVLAIPEALLPPALYQGDTVPLQLKLVNPGTQAAPAGLVNLTSDPPIHSLPKLVATPAVAAGGTYYLEVPGLQPARNEPVFRPAQFAAVDKDLDGAAGPAEPVYLAVRPDAPSSGFQHPSGNGTLRAGDLRINVTGSAAGRPLVAGDRDLATSAAGPLLPLPLAKHLRCAAIDAPLRCRPGDALYLDLTDNGTVSPGDIRLTPLGNRSGGARVLGLEPDTGRPMQSAGLEGCRVAFADRNGDGAYGGGDPVVLDCDGGAAVGPGDLRLSALLTSRGQVAKPLGSTVAANDTDDGLALAPGPLGSQDVDGVLGRLRFRAVWTAGDAQPAEAVADTWVRTAGLRVSVFGPIAAVPGETVDLLAPPKAFTVTNLGNVREDVVLLPSASAGEASLLGEPRLSLAPGESRTVPVRVALPPRVAAGEADLRLRAMLVNRSATQAQAAVNVTFQDLASPTAAFRELPEVWDPLHPLLVTVEAADDIGVSAVTLAVTSDGGAQTFSLNRTEGTDDWSAAVPLAEGNYSLVAQAEDAAGHHTSAQGAVRIASVPPPAFLALEVMSPSARNGTGSVRAVLADATGLASVVLRIDGGSALPLALSVPADGDGSGGPTVATARLPTLAPGPHNVVVEAANRAGRTALESREITAPPAPAAGGEGRSSPAPVAALLLLGLLAAASSRRR